MMRETLRSGDRRGQETRAERGRAIGGVRRPAPSAPVTASPLVGEVPAQRGMGGRRYRKPGASNGLLPKNWSSQLGRLRVD